MLSYDVDGHDRTTAARVCQLILGRRNTTTREGRPAVYDQAGFVHRQGVVWVGQSVLVLPERDAFELRGRLEGMGVSLGIGRLVIAGPDLEVFRRRGRARGRHRHS